MRFRSWLQTHAAGKPKAIDDVEGLRTVIERTEPSAKKKSRSITIALATIASLVPATVHGYDQEFLKHVERTIDNRIKLQKNIWWRMSF